MLNRIAIAALKRARALPPRGKATKSRAMRERRGLKQETRKPGIDPR
jgi:hypothetical protein